MCSLFLMGGYVGQLSVALRKIPGETILKKDFFRCLSFRGFCPWSFGAIISRHKAGGHDEQSYSPHVSQDSDRKGPRQDKYSSTITPRDLLLPAVSTPNSPFNSKLNGSFH